MDIAHAKYITDEDDVIVVFTHWFMWVNGFELQPNCCETLPDHLSKNGGCYSLMYARKGASFSLECRPINDEVMEVKLTSNNDPITKTKTTMVKVNKLDCVNYRLVLENASAVYRCLDMDLLKPHFDMDDDMITTTTVAATDNDVEMPQDISIPKLISELTI